MRQRGVQTMLAAALLGSAALLLSYVSDLSFLSDEWQLLIGRPGWALDVFLRPFNENPVAAVAAIYKVQLAIFGMESALPFYAVSIGLFLLCAVLLFVYLERRAGAWAALFGAVLVLFLGAAYEDLFWAFQMGYLGSVAAGLGALLALDREDRRGDALACPLLVLTVAFSSVGLAFIAAGLADLAFGGRPRRRRAYVSLLPAAAFVGWWLGWQQTAPGQLSIETVAHTPRFVFEAAAAGLASLLGREPMTAAGHPPALAQALVLVVVVGAGLRLARQRAISRGTAVALALALTYWASIGLDRTGGVGFALSSRYQYPSAVFLLILAGELLRVPRVPRPVWPVLALVTAGAVVGGLSIMRHQFDVWKGISDQTRLKVSVLEVGRPGIPPGSEITFPPSVRSTARAYFAGIDRFGSPAYDETQLLALPEVERRAADRMLAASLGLELSRGNGGLRAGRCRTLASPRRRQAVALHPGTYEVVNLGRDAANLRLGRFASAPSVPVGRIPSGGVRTLPIPPDASSREWRLISSIRPVRLCAERKEPRPA